MKTTSEVSKYYLSHLEQLNTEQKKLRLDAAKIGWLRLFVFLLIVGFIWTGFSISSLLFIGAAISLVGFLFLVKLHLQKQFERELGEVKIKIIENEISTLNYEPQLWDNGEKFHHAASYSYDLDIFGGYSVFHFINRAATVTGQQHLAETLIHPSTNEKIILKRQDAIKEIKEKSTFRLQWQGFAQLLPAKNDLSKQLNENLSFKNEFVDSGFIKFLLILAPLLMISATTYYYVSAIWQPMVFAFILNTMIAGLFLKKTNQRQKSVDGLQKMMTSYSRMIECFLSDEWKSELLNTKASEITEAKKAFAELANISEWFDRRSNIVVGITFNGYTLYDLHCSIRLEKWKIKYAHKCENWFSAIAEIESMQSLGTFAFNHPEFHFPTINSESKISAEELAHPLIPSNKNIHNDILMAHPEKIILITGSNMSGKSTFLRTVGVNLVLAQAGLPVNAKRMDFTPMYIQTSLKQSDNLHENVSLFHAELLRLKSIREHLKKGELTLVLLDEMLRGTNSEDKLYGSRQLIEELLEENIFGLIASHDLELGKLEEKYPGKLRNACFESVITGNDLIFDYKLKPGIARNKNATFLLKKMEIIHDKTTSH